MEFYENFYGRSQIKWDIQRGYCQFALQCRARNCAHLIFLHLTLECALLLSPSMLLLLVLGQFAQRIKFDFFWLSSRVAAQTWRYTSNIEFCRSLCDLRIIIIWTTCSESVTELVTADDDCFAGHSRLLTTHYPLRTIDWLPTTDSC